MSFIKIWHQKRDNSKNKCPRRTLFNYSPSQIKNALEEIRNGMKIQTACKMYNVPRSTIRNKLLGRAPETTGKVGKDPVLGEEVENRLVEWIKETSRAGFPICREGLIYSVQKLVKEAELNTPFKNGTSGRKWFHLFMSRHPDLSRKQSEYINRARSLVTEKKIKSWFAETLELLGDDKSVLEDPARVWNMDETAMYLCPKGTLVLAEKGVPVCNTSANSDKENITTLLTVSAAGHMAPPLTLYKYDRLPKNVSKNAPPEWAIGKSPKGWTSSAFYEYFANVLLSYLKKDQC
ncbi:hypothetical protein NQ314_003307 [Rhamnusium bicolor]|uniref:HTH CENPB-type domain-containing protein n=1 Tax=Rhamnusium bicolor TaxID=1586634 RepID=A0AAV8ZPJ2_9CUCU|nr:hypothetical protein NQ314_003307 [Rhamnusium bicolor]